MRILVTGAGGAIGTPLSEYLCEIGHEIIPVVRHGGTISVDLRDEATVFRLVEEYTPDLIVHLAAITNLRFCEQNKETARATNYGVTEILTKACSAFGIRMIFFSTDYVFGQYNQFWQEEDPTCPTTQYGIDKADAELLIQERLADYAIVRTAQLYGISGDFVRLVCEMLNTGHEFKAFANLINCPTWIGDLFPMIRSIIDRNHQGIFHCVGPEALSRYQYAYTIAETFGLNTAYIQATHLDFSVDSRPPVVRLDGASTYETLQVYPKKIQENLALHASYARTTTQ